MGNQQSWNLKQVVRTYQNETALQKPEQTILELFRDRLKGWNMLDIGIGLGRTTLHFAPLVKSYVGIDYSQVMVDSCKADLTDFPTKVSIHLGDARSMPEFESGSFEFILFSYNGLDYISHDDRPVALREIKRLGKSGGYFVFSTHNIRYVDHLFTVKFGNSLKHFAYQCYRYLRLILENGVPSKHRDTDWAILVDGANHFKMKTYYINPSFQLEQLKKMGFKNIRQYSLRTGDEMDERALKNTTRDSWIYFVCEIP